MGKEYCIFSYYLLIFHKQYTYFRIGEKIMQTNAKYDLILDALAALLQKKNMQDISISEIARTAGIGKGSIYYYFSSKKEILQALVERNYREPLSMAHKLASQTDIPPFQRMAMIFHACRNSSADFLRQSPEDPERSAQQALLHQNYLNCLIRELKPELSTIIAQGIASGQVLFDNPDALAEIVLIVLTVKLDNTINPTSAEETRNTICGLISLLEKVTTEPSGTLNFLITK